MTKIKSYLLLILTVVILYSCGIYSFNGASIPNGAETVSVKYFTNKADNVQPNLSQILTEKLKDIFVEQTNLIIAEEEGNLSFSGYISNYEIKPIGIQSNEIAEQNRLTITVNVTFKSSLDSKADFEQIFKRHRDYNSSINISEIEEMLIGEACDELVEDIFNKAVVNW